MKMSYACRLAPFSSRAVVPWKPRSPIQCRAHAWAAVEVEPQVGDVVPEPRFEPVDEPAEARLRLRHREVAVRLACAGDRVAPDRVRIEREADLAELVRDALRVRLGTPTRIRFCWRAIRMSAPTSSARSAIAISRSPVISPRRIGTPIEQTPGSRCGWMPRWLPGWKPPAPGRSPRVCGQAAPRRARACRRRPGRRP